jgi:hypothetical protein
LPKNQGMRQKIHLEDFLNTTCSSKESWILETCVHFFEWVRKTKETKKVPLLSFCRRSCFASLASRWDWKNFLNSFFS